MKSGCLVLVLAAGVLPGCASAERRAVAEHPERWSPLVLSSAGEIRVPPPDAAGAAPAGAADPVSPWIERALRSVALHTKNPPAAARAYGMVSVAMYDAAVSAAHWQHAYGEEHPGYPSIAAAISGAGSRTLAHLYPEESRSRLDSAARKLAGKGAAARAGLELGREVAARLVASRAADDPARDWTGKAPRGRGSWAPPPGSVAHPVAPLAATWRTWLLDAPDAVRPPPPPAYGSAEYLAAAREVVATGRRLTAEQKRSALFWAGGESTGLPPGIWNQAALEAVRARELSAAGAARVFALLNVAMSDAAVATWDAKYHYWTARPVNAVADLEIAANWTPLLPTPVFPSYPSGHAAFSAAAGEVLAHVFPDQADVFRDRAREAAMSRLYGGIHFRFDNEAGLDMGRSIGREVVAWDRTHGPGL